MTLWFLVNKWDKKKWKTHILQCKTRALRIWDLNNNTCIWVEMNIVCIYLKVSLTDAKTSWFIRHLLSWSLHQIKYWRVVIWCASYLLFFSWQMLQWENFVMTSKTFPVDSKHASAIPVLDQQPRVFQDQSKLALISELWLLSSFSVIFSWPVLHRYNFALCASNFKFTFTIFSLHSEIASVWPLQLWALIGLSMFKILATLLAPECPFPIDRNANTAVRNLWLLRFRHLVIFVA